MKAEVQKLVEEFGRRMADLVQVRARELVAGSLRHFGPARVRIALPAVWHEVADVVEDRTLRAARRKGPIQLCPAPRCTGRAAPVFSMLCAEHKGTAKATVTKWREARRARKAH